jgi:hypothetical protein
MFKSRRTDRAKCSTKEEEEEECIQVITGKERKKDKTKKTKM